MNTGTIRILIAVFFIAHAWIHVGLAQVPAPQAGGLQTPFLPSWWRDAVSPSWPVSKLGLPPQLARPLGYVLWVLAATAFIVGGLALLIAPAQAGLWQGLTIAGSVISLALLGLYWHNWYPVGALIDLALLGAVILKYPAALFSR